MSFVRNIKKRKAHPSKVPPNSPVNNLDAPLDFTSVNDDFSEANEIKKIASPQVAIKSIDLKDAYVSPHFSVVLPGEQVVAALEKSIIREGRKVNTTVLAIIDTKTGKIVEEIEKKDTGITNGSIGENFVIKDERYLIFRVGRHLLVRDLLVREPIPYKIIGKLEDPNFRIEQLLLNTFTGQLISLHPHKTNNTKHIALWDVENFQQITCKELKIDLPNSLNIANSSIRIGKIECFSADQLIIHVINGYGFEINDYTNLFYQLNLKTFQNIFLFERKKIDYILDLQLSGHDLMWIEITKNWSLYSLMKVCLQKKSSADLYLLQENIKEFYQVAAKKHKPGFFAKFTSPVDTLKSITSFVEIPEGFAVLHEDGELKFLSHQGELIHTSKVKLSNRSGLNHQSLKWDPYQENLLGCGQFEVANIDCDYKSKYQTQVEQHLIPVLSNIVMDYFGFFKSSNAIRSKTNEVEGALKLKI